MTASRVFMKPPFGWKVGSLGLLALSGFIGAIIAFFLGGRLVDLISTRMTKANRGIREPEFRLPATILPAIIGPMGVLTFGICAGRRLTWVGAAFGYGMQAFGLTAVSNVVVTYAVDSYHQVRFCMSSRQHSVYPLTLVSPVHSLLVRLLSLSLLSGTLSPCFSRYTP